MSKHVRRPKACRAVRKQASSLQSASKSGIGGGCTASRRLRRSRPRGWLRLGSPSLVLVLLCQQQKEVTLPRSPARLSMRSHETGAADRYILARSSDVGVQVEHAVTETDRYTPRQSETRNERPQIRTQEQESAGAASRRRQGRQQEHTAGGWPHRCSGHTPMPMPCIRTRRGAPLDHTAAGTAATAGTACFGFAAPPLAPLPSA